MGPRRRQLGKDLFCFFLVKVVIKTAEASIEHKGLHDLAESDRSKLFFLCRPVCVCRGRGVGGWEGDRFFSECVWEMLVTIALLSFPIMLWSCPLGLIPPMAGNIYVYKYAPIGVHPSLSLYESMFLWEKHSWNWTRMLPGAGAAACARLWPAL